MKSFLVFVYITLGVWCVPLYAHAGLSINEIMYDLAGTDTDHEWIELHNDSSSSITLEGYKFNDGANHGLNAPPVNGGAGSLSVPANGYVILAANATVFKNDYPSYSGTVIDTVMALANEGDSLSIVDSNNDVIDSVTYTKSQGGAGDGNSLGSFGNVLAPGTPTPGSVNTKTTTEVEENEEETEEEEIEVDKEYVIPRYAGTISVKDPITKGVPTQFSTLIVNTERKVVLPGRYVWNFGDGTVHEYFDGLPFTHIYNDAGEYVVYFEYYKSRGAFTPEIVIKKIISVTDGGVLITSLGTPSEPKVELSNTTGDDIDLSMWKIHSGSTSYVLPKNTILMKGKKIILRPSVLGFSPLYSATLIHPSGVVASAKSSTIALANTSGGTSASTATKSVARVSTVSVKGESDSIVASSGPVDPVDSGDSSLTENTLSANTLTAVDSLTMSKDFSKLIYYGLFVIVLIVGVVAVFRIRRTSKEEKDADEYDPDEFTLVE
ncbi:MAG: lamin tail domain-containing protein [Candidatus Pacebacteria bacterium]|nr:lamin tail domain-containing protein [Candidatus Paceibacterota bacterium]MBP9780984.1 lamin tail domain-containing protein [Candidatus Paceibacterota bacterium]